jgi:hypothetical protein
MQTPCKHGAEYMGAEIMSSEYGVLCTPMWGNPVHICTRIEHPGDRGGILGTLEWRYNTSMRSEHMVVSMAYWVRCHAGAPQVKYMDANAELTANSGGVLGTLQYRRYAGQIIWCEH